MSEPKPLPPRENIGELPAWEYVEAGAGCAIVYFRCGAARVFFRSSGEGENPRGDRGIIMDQSMSSRLRAAWTFLCAHCTWYGMTTLTWRHDPAEGFFVPSRDEVMRATDYLRRAFRARWGEGLDAWIMECTRTGCPHFHLFHAAESEFGQALLVAPKEWVTRKGKPTQIVRGGPDYWMRAAWLRAIRRRDDEPTRLFNSGGIIEIFRSSAGACRYVAKEAGKAYQKVLPEEYEQGLGQWWYLNARWQPRVTAIQNCADLRQWPYEHPISRVFDAEELALVMPGEAHIVSGERVNLATWESWAKM